MEPQDERKALGQVIRALRELEGHSREDLAKKIQMSTVMVAKIEQGAKAPSAKTLTKIAQVYGLGAVELSRRALIWASLMDSPEESAAGLLSVATTGAPAVGVLARTLGIPRTPGGPIAVAAAGAGALTAAVLEISTRREMERVLRRFLEVQLENASTDAHYVKLAEALESVRIVDTTTNESASGADLAGPADVNEEA